MIVVVGLWSSGKYLKQNIIGDWIINDPEIKHLYYLTFNNDGTYSSGVIASSYYGNGIWDINKGKLILERREFFDHEYENYEIVLFEYIYKKVFYKQWFY
jgi:hypothetical protein